MPTKNSTAETQLTHEQVGWQQQSFPLIVACDNWSDPRNVGMAFRLAEAFGVQALWLGGTTPVPPNRKMTKTSRSTTHKVPFQHQISLPTALQGAKAEGYVLVGIEITSQSKNLRELAQTHRKQATILVLGAEKGGISPEVLAVLDACAHIPMYGNNSSLNVATALSISLYAWTEARLD